METYAAGETPRSVTANSLVSLVNRYEPNLAVSYAATPASAITQLAAQANEGDLVILLGAGDIHTIAQPLLQAIEVELNLSAQTA
jgi:UDP-N-acetylmuramate-alanine ligase